MRPGCAEQLVIPGKNADNKPFERKCNICSPDSRICHVRFICRNAYFSQSPRMFIPVVLQQHFTEKHSRSHSNMKNIYVIAYNRIYIYSLSIRAVYALVDGYSCGNKIRMNNIEIIFFHVYMRMKKKHRVLP